MLPYIAMNAQELNRVPAIRWAVGTVAVGALVAAGVYFLILSVRAFRTGRFVGRGGVVETGARARAAAVMCMMLALLGFAAAAMAVIGGIVYPVR